MNFCLGVTIEIKFYHVTPSMVYVIMRTKVVQCNIFAREAVVKKFCSGKAQYFTVLLLTTTYTWHRVMMKFKVETYFYYIAEKLSVNNFFSKFEKIRKKFTLLKKSLTGNLLFCAVLTC